MGSSKRNRKPLSWAEALEQALNNEIKSPEGEGWLRRVEFSKKYKIGEVKSNRLIREGLKNGLFEKFEGNRKNENGKMVKAIWYRPVQDK
jgi:hypothetical protein